MDNVKAIRNVRTMEDVAYLLNILYTNLNNLDRVYYDMFINPVPMDIELQRYDEKGELVTVVLPNRAKDIISTYTGLGNPNGKQVADVGALYLDLDSLNMFYKSAGSDSYGWTMLLSSTNLVADVDYLTPTGDGSQLTNLNLSNVGSGVLRVDRGGTGVTSITGVLKGNGINPLSPAVEDEDFIAPNGLTGIICYYPVTTIPKGWLVCDGATYSRATYLRLFNKIGVKYGSGDGVTTFNVPNLSGVTIRGYQQGYTQDLGIVRDGTVGGHAHSVTGSTTQAGGHTHTRGSMNITGGPIRCMYDTIGGGALWTDGVRKHSTEGNGSYNFDFYFDASRSWTGSTSVGGDHTHTVTGTAEFNSGDENTVKNITLIPIIKY